MMGLLVVNNNFRKNVYHFEYTDIKKQKKGGVKTPVETWMEIYLQNAKVGYSQNRIQPLDEGYLAHESLFLRLNLMGRPSLIQTETQAALDEAFRLKNFHFSMRSGTTTFSVRGEIKDRWMIIRQKGSPETKIRLEGPLYTGASFTYLFRNASLAVGKSLSIPFFDPSTLTRNTLVLTVTGKETIRIHDVPYRTFRLETNLMGQHLFFWVNEDGDLLKESGLMGMQLVRSNASRATEGLSGRGGSDYYQLASVESDRKLRHPRDLSFLKVRLQGIAETPFKVSALNGGRQRYEKGTLEIRKEQLPPVGSLHLSRMILPSDARAYLEPELNVESHDPEIRRMARAVGDGEQDSVLVAEKLLKWVFQKIEKRPVLTIPSAREVLKTRVGDCNEHAVLLTALLRASSVPARVCAGLVYAKGKFFYHAWTECWLGKWISMDATLNQMPADATHIALVRGSVEKQTGIIALMGKVKVEVLDYKYD